MMMMMTAAAVVVVMMMMKTLVALQHPVGKTQMLRWKDLRGRRRFSTLSFRRLGSSWGYVHSSNINSIPKIQKTQHREKKSNFQKEVKLGLTVEERLKLCVFLKATKEEEERTRR